MTPEVKKLLAFWKAERRQRKTDARNQSPGRHGSALSSSRKERFASAFVPV